MRAMVHLCYNYATAHALRKILPRAISSRKIYIMFSPEYRMMYDIVAKLPPILEDVFCVRQKTFMQIAPKDLHVLTGVS